MAETASYVLTEFSAIGLADLSDGSGLPAARLQWDEMPQDIPEAEMRAGVPPFAPGGPVSEMTADFGGSLVTVDSPFIGIDVPDSWSVDAAADWFADTVLATFTAMFGDETAAFGLPHYSFAVSAHAVEEDANPLSSRVGDLAGEDLISFDNWASASIFGDVMIAPTLAGAVNAFVPEESLVPFAQFTGDAIGDIAALLQDLAPGWDPDAVNDAGGPAADNPGLPLPPDLPESSPQGLEYLASAGTLVPLEYLWWDTDTDAAL